MAGTSTPHQTVLQTTTATGTGYSFGVPAGPRAFQAVLTCSSGNCSATVVWEVSIDGVNFVTQATTTFSSAASPQTDGFQTDSVWPNVRTRVTAISGTGASVTTYMVQ